MNLHVASKVKSVDLLFDYLTPALPRRWTHFCVVYKEEGQSASVFQVINDNMNFYTTIFRSFDHIHW